MAWTFLEIVAVTGLICSSVSAINALVSVLEKAYIYGKPIYASLKKI